MYGSYVAPAGTPPEMLALPYSQIGQPMTYLEVQQALQAMGGQVAPWFNSMGGGTQYLLDTPIYKLIADGVLKILGE